MALAIVDQFLFVLVEIRVEFAKGGLSPALVPRRPIVLSKVLISPILSKNAFPLDTFVQIFPSFLEEVGIGIIVTASLFPRGLATSKTNVSALLS